MDQPTQESAPSGDAAVRTVEEELAPGRPGIEARWTSSAKSGVGTALGPAGRVWFSISHGILNEVYYPRVDQACTRDLGLLVSDGAGFFSEEKRHTRNEITPLAEGVPGYHLVNTCLRQRYRIDKEVIADPAREVVLQRIRFTPLAGELADYSLYALLAPHLGNSGADNTAWVGEFKGMPMLFAERQGIALALACSTPWVRGSAGYVGASDGWQDVSRHGRMAWRFGRAEQGNVALTGQIDLATSGGSFTLALAFGRNTDEAGHRAATSLWDGFERARECYCRDWQDWQKSLRSLEPPVPGGRDLYRVSTAVMRTHESSRFPGAIIASLSLPWGFSKGDGELGGYHLVWPRDLVETAGGLLAAGAGQEVLRILRYLAITQEASGCWPQNMWVDGRPYWGGIQMDETGFPILLLDLALRHDVLDADSAAQFWPMVRRAAQFLACNGPVTLQDRWEEDPGYSPFTLAVEVAALLCAAELADTHEPALSGYLRETADTWNSMIERWTYARGGEFAEEAGVDGYYVRIAPPESADGPTSTDGYVPIKNRPPGESDAPASHIISPDALALVRFGLRAPDDPRIVNTVKVIDSMLRFEAPQGPLWHRYNGDGYGEHDNGEPFDGTGKGRLWPLLTGERAHFELAAGRTDQARALAATLSHCSNEGGLLPEQVWDADDLPEHELFLGRPSGSAMPLVWAHAEYVKLCRSLVDGRVFDTPPQTVQRYQVEKRGSELAIWRFNHKCQRLPAGRRLRIELQRPAEVHWSSDGWQSSQRITTRDTQLGIHLADLPTANLAIGSQLEFALQWTGESPGDSERFTIDVSQPDQEEPQ